MSENPELFTTVRQEAHVEFEEKRSVFIGHALRTDTEEEAQAFVKQMKKQYQDATHNVFAYLMRGETVARYSDDGEPQGTAGMPVLDVIRKSGVRNVCVVVTRYFGGTLLGAGGLVRAYSHSASLALEAAGIITYQPYGEYELRCGYSEYQKYSVMLANAGAVIDDTEFGADVCVRFAAERGAAELLVAKIIEAGYGKDVPQKVGERFDYR
ncbi:MAG: YigZ family protein [Clostridia bacterium]|nr:YigZ family protein [Clostridia bacterium]